MVKTHKDDNPVPAITSACNTSIENLSILTEIDLSCNIPNVVHIISYKNCGDQSVGSANDFKARFRIYKSDIKTKKDSCGIARHFNNKCGDSNNHQIFLQAL